MEPIEKYMKFMYHKENVECCLLCPINKGKADGRCKPCGKTICVVLTHLKEMGQ